MTVNKGPHHHHFAIYNNMVIEWYSTTRGLRWRPKRNVEHPDQDEISEEELGKLKELK